MKKKKNNFFKSLWPKIDTKDDSFQVLRNCQVLCFYLVFSYLINALFNYNGILLWSEGKLDDFDKIFMPLWFLSGAVLFLWLGFRIRKNKFGLVPIISMWLIIECVTTIIVSPSPGGIILRIYLILVAIGCIRAWLFNRKLKIN